MTNQLPPQGPPGSDDKLPGEAELTALYRKLPQAEPSPALDDAVRRMAAAAVSSDRPRRRARWPVALGTAATLVLAAALGWRMREMPSNMPAPPPPAAPIAAAPVTADAAAIREAAAPPPLPPAMVAPRPITPTLTRHAPASHRQQPRTIAPAPMAMKARAAAPRPMPPPPAAMVSHPVAAPPAVSELPVERHVAKATADRIDRAEPAEQAAIAPASPPAPAPVAAPSANGFVAPNATPPAARELDAIRRLFAEGHADEARQRLRAFHRAHPQWALPDALRSELRKP